MLTATCYCGAVRVEVPRKPRRLTDCNCKSAPSPLDEYFGHATSS